MHAGGVADNHGAWLDEKDPLEVRIKNFVMGANFFLVKTTKQCGRVKRLQSIPPPLSFLVVMFVFLSVINLVTFSVV